MSTLAFIQFDRPAWLWLLPPLVVLTVWIGRKSLSGMGTITRRVALAVRILVLALLVAALAQPQWSQVSESVAVTVVLDASRSLPTEEQADAQKFIAEAGASAKPKDLVGMVTAARDSFVQSLPGPVGPRMDVQHIGATDATNLEAAVRLGMAVMRQDSANRLLIISDGNETAGSLLAAAKSAQAAKVPIDVLPRRFSLDREVIVERLVAPATARQGENANLKIVLTSTTKTVGKLSILMNGVPVDLDPDTDAFSAKIEVPAGTSYQMVPVALPGQGDVRFEAIFEPMKDEKGIIGDRIAENNRAVAVTFVGGEGRVLVLTSRPNEAARLITALRESGIRTELREPSQAPAGLVQLSAYEGIVLVNCSAYEFSLQQQEELKNYVHELGGGLVMIGGDQAFGAGGWIGSPLADALPIRLDPPQKRQMPKGALMLVMHSCEVPEGNYWGRRCAEAAIDALSSRDLAGIVEHNWAGGNDVVHPLSPVGDKSAIKRAANSLTYGDAPSFDEMLTAALGELEKAAAGQKHVIMISDGDPGGPTQTLLDRFIAAKISISTVAVFPHGRGGELAKMEDIARQTGGTYHELTQNNQLNSLPQIFIKEAQVIKRSMLWEGDPFSPAFVGGGSEPMRGISTPVPPITGYVVGAEREGLAQTIFKGQENDPVMAQWQYGLGRVIAFTSDATSRYATAWVKWAQFNAFWRQHLLWAMRPGSNPNMRVVTSDEGEQTRVVVEALDDQGERMDFLRWRASVVDPEGKGSPFALRQVGPGRYEALVPTAVAGAYVLNMGYEQSKGDKVERGSVQAAIARPFADEFRSLRDNAPLLEQVAKLTGGRVIDADPRKADLWSADGLTMPISLQPIWLAVAVAGIGFFLADVAIRRVRIDIPLIVGALRRAFGRSKLAAGQQIDSLKAARERAQAQIAARGQTSPIRSHNQESVLLDQQAASTSNVKFEATAGEMAAARLSAQAAQAAQFAQQQTGSAPVTTRSAPKPDGKPEEAGISRLMKAKKRAQDEMGET